MKKIIASRMLPGAFFIVALTVGFSFPFSLSAQSYGPRYGRSPVTGAEYLLPTQGLGDEYFSQSSAASGLSVACAPSSPNAAVGQTVTWFSSVSGGTGSYLYTWSGTEGLSGNAVTAQKAYAARGEKIATLTVTSGSRLVTVSCGSVIIGTGSFSGASFAQSRFGASCYAIPERALPGESVTWLSLVSGVTASTTYSWDGTDGLSGDRPLVSKTYATNGNKAAMLTVTDGSDRIVAACTNAVAVGAKAPAAPQKPTAPSPVSPQPVIPELQGLCAPSSSRASINEEVVWHAVAIGGTGVYRFLWGGDDELFGEGATTSKQYETGGSKRAMVKIDSGEKTATIGCYSIEITKAKKGLSVVSFSSWFDGPVGFIIAAILAIIFGVFIAVRKRSKEETGEEERDHVQ